MAVPGPEDEGPRSGIYAGERRGIILQSSILHVSGVRLCHVGCNIVDIFAFVYWQDLDVGGDEKES